MAGYSFVQYNRRNRNNRNNENRNNNNYQIGRHETTINIYSIKFFVWKIFEFIVKKTFITQ